MPKQVFTVTELGRFGIVPDQTPRSTSPKVFSDNTNNVRFAEGQVRNFPGFEAVTVKTSQGEPYYHIMPYRSAAGNQSYIVFSLTEAWKHEGAAGNPGDTEVTRVSGDYSWDESYPFTSNNFHGIALINNFADYPQAMGLSDTDFDDLKWDGSGDWAAELLKCKTLRPFKNLLMAGHLNENGTVRKHKLRWSDIADAGALPATWDETDATALAGVHELSETPGGIVDMLPMRDSMIIYKDDAVYAADYVGAPYMFRFRLITAQYGLVNANCVVELGDGRHCCWLRQGPHVFDGSRMHPVGYARVRQELIDDPENYNHTYLVHNVTQGEVWFCYVDSAEDETGATKAWVWNYIEDIWSKTDLPFSSGATGQDGCSFICVGDDLGVTWYWPDPPGISAPADLGNYLPGEVTLYGVYGDGICRLNKDPQEAGADKTCTAEIRGINIGERGSANMVTYLYPFMWANTGSVNFYVGGQDHPEDSVTWEGPYSFTPGTDEKVAVRVTGNLHAVKLESAEDMNWVWTGFDMVYSPSGLRRGGG